MTTYVPMEMRFELDEEKIEREGIYDLEKIYAAIDKVATQNAHMIKVSKDLYRCKGNKYDLGNMGILIYEYLIDRDWFTKNVKCWEWIEKNGSIDLIAKNKQRGLGVWE